MITIDRLVASGRGDVNYVNRFSKG